MLAAYAFELFILLCLGAVGVFAYEILIRSRLFKFLRLTPPADTPEEFLIDLGDAKNSAAAAALRAEVESKKQADAAETLRKGL